MKVYIVTYEYDEGIRTLVLSAFSSFEYAISYITTLIAHSNETIDINNSYIGISTANIALTNGNYYHIYYYTLDSDIDIAMKV